MTSVFAPLGKAFDIKIGKNVNIPLGVPPPPPPLLLGFDIDWCIDLVPAATEKVSLIRSNSVWNRCKSTLRAGSIKVNLNHGTEM